MPGSPLNLVYPVLGEPIATALGKIITMFQVIQNDLQGLIVPAEFNWLTDLSAQGHSLTHLGFLGFDNSNVVGVPAGGMIYDGANFWLITAGGAVKVTNGPTINIASTGGIVGDYSSAGASVYFDSGTNQYRFFSGTGARSDLVFADAWLEAATGGGSIKLKADDALASARTFTLKDQPGANTSILTIDSSGNIAPGATISNTQSYTAAQTYTGGVTVNTGDLSVGSNAKLTGTADFFHVVQWELPIPLSNTQSTGFWGTAGDHTTSVSPDGGASRVYRQWIPGLRVGDVIQKATWRFLRNAGTHTFDVKKVVDGTETSLLAAVTTVTTGAAQTAVATLVTPYTVVANEQYILTWTPPSLATLDRIYSSAVFVTH